ncbi:MAG: GNAT family N-acetyltransferase [Pseudonocardia sp.]|nr:GNAT family N-acetyltransferase [Pseudonocardia sp.]
MNRLVRQPTEADHARVLAALESWWGGLGGVEGTAQRTALLPRLFFQHFTNTSLIVEEDGELLGFLIGFLSQSQPDEAYIHFVGVAPALRGAGHGRQLYERFFTLVQPYGCRVVRAITSVTNVRSQAFHISMGFAVEHSETQVNGRSVQSDYDGPGLDRVTFIRILEAS